MATQFPEDSINNRQGANNPLHKLEQNGYNVASFSYPIDLTNDPGENHMIVFYINESSTTQYGTRNASGNLTLDQDTGQKTKSIQPTAFSNRRTPIPTAEVFSPRAPAQAQANSSQNYQQLKRNVNRVPTVITMYIPPLVQTTYQTQWETTEMGAIGGAIQGLMGGNPNIVRTLGEFAAATAKDLLDSAVDAASKKGVIANVTDIASLGTRVASNPHLEMIFRGIGFREFQFDFKFTPRSQDEAMNVANIVKAFKFYSAPEVRTAANTPKFYIYPAEFDIEFWSNGFENEWINKISTCACTSCVVNYTGANMWSAFRNGKINGMGVETNLTLCFKELEIITKERIIQGF
jgi:hypothetical protein